MEQRIVYRINQIRKGNIPTGYTKTKDGIVPSDWTIKKMKQWISLKERPVTLQDDADYELITVRRAYGGVDSRGIYKGKEVLVKNYFFVEKDDFIISKRQIAHGACGLVSEELQGAVVSNEYNVFKANEKTNIQFFNLMMQLPHYKRLFFLMSDGVHIEKLLFKTGDWMNRSLAMPPLPEQKKIAEILSAQDKLIALKEKLIEEKKRQKKYLMQQLLTGKMRLPGFSGEWYTERLDDFCLFVGGGTPDTKNVEYWQGDIPWISSSDLRSDDLYNVNTNRYITNDAVQSSATKKCPAGSILVVTRVGVGKVAIAPTELCTSQDFTSVIQNKYDNMYIAYAIYWLMQEKSTQVQGSSIKGVPSKEFQNYTVHIPPINEQYAIVSVLSAIDREIDLLAHIIDQEKQKKKALMQLLLSGVVRVNV